jgi:hypothetical protein
MDAKLQYISAGKTTATRAIELDVSGAKAEAIAAYNTCCEFLQQGLSLETDPDALVTLKGKISSFERRISELQEDSISSLDGVNVMDDEQQPSSPQWCDGDEPNLDYFTAKLPKDVTSSGPSSQLRSSQEELAGLLRSKEELESQIQDARHRAETYTKSLEEARLSTELKSSRNSNSNANRNSNSNTNKNEAETADDSSVATHDTTTTNNTNIAVTGGSSNIRRNISDRLAALERLVKVQQRELIVANTDLRVSKARSVALQQKLVDSLGQEEGSETTHQLALAESFIEQVKERMREAEIAKVDALALNRALVEKLQTSQEECRNLQQIVEQMGARLAASGANPEEVTSLPLPLPLPPAMDNSDGGSMLSSSSMSTTTDVSTTIMRRWRQQARENLISGDMQAGTASSPDDSFEETKGLIREGYTMARGHNVRNNNSNSNINNNSNSNSTSTSGDILMGGGQDVTLSPKTIKSAKAANAAITVDTYQDNGNGSKPTISNSSKSASKKTDDDKRVAMTLSTMKTAKRTSHTHSHPSAVASPRRAVTIGSSKMGRSRLAPTPTQRRTVKVVVPSSEKQGGLGSTLASSRKNPTPSASASASTSTSRRPTSASTFERTVRRTSEGRPSSSSTVRSTRSGVPLHAPRSNRITAAAALNLSLESVGSKSRRRDEKRRGY